MRIIKARLYLYMHVAPGLQNGAAMLALSKTWGAAVIVDATTMIASLYGHKTRFTLRTCAERVAHQ